MRREASLALVLPAVVISAAFAEEPKPAYDFSLPRAEKIALAESAAPPEISGKATVYVLEKKGISSRLILIPDEGHGSSKRGNQVIEIGNVLKFFEVHLRGGKSG